MRSVNTRVSLAKPPNVFEQIVLGIRRRQFGFDPFQGGMKTVEPFAELSRCGRNRVAPAELKVINRFIEVTTQASCVSGWKALWLYWPINSSTSLALRNRSGD